MAYKYCTATNWGKNFFTHEERRNFYLAGHPGDVWVVGDNMFGDQWISKVSGVSKTKAEAQSLVDAAVQESRTQQQNYINSLEDSEEKTRLQEQLDNSPETVTLP